MLANANVTVVTSSTPVQFASRAEDHVCKTMQLRITGDPPDSATWIAIYSLQDLIYKTPIPPFNTQMLPTYILQITTRALPTSNHTSATITEASFDPPFPSTTSVPNASTSSNTSDANRQSNIDTPPTTIIPFIQDITDSFPSHSFDLSIPPRQPFDLSYFTPYCYSPKMQIQTLPNFSKKAYPQGLFPKYNLGLWEPNTKIQDDVPDLQMCKDIWTSANQDPEITKQLIQKELADGFIGEIPDIKTAEKRWPQGIGLGKLGETHDWSSVPLSAV